MCSTMSYGLKFYAQLNSNHRHFYYRVILRSLIFRSTFLLLIYYYYTNEHIINKIKMIFSQANTKKRIKQPLHRSSPKQLLNDSLFTCKRQQQFFLEQLRKGTLFKWSPHIKPQTNQIQKQDPYVDWLKENSLIEQEQIIKERKMGETFFYLNTQEFDKQKKIIKNTLPKIQKVKKQSKLKSQNVSQIRKGFSLHIFQKKSKYDQLQDHQSLLKRLKQSNFFPTNNKQKRILKQAKQSFESIVNKNHFHEKETCFQNKLNKTQFLQRMPSRNTQNLYQSFYSNKQNLMKSHLYLNDHKKYPYNDTFYTHKNKQIQVDYDLKRVKGLDESIKCVKPIQKSLQKLQKNGSLSCYNDISKYFQSMGKQVHKVVQNAIKQTKLLQNNKSIYMDRLMLDQSIIQVNQQKSASDPNLPQFLLKTLSSFSLAKQSAQKDLKNCNSFRLNKSLRLNQNLRLTQNIKLSKKLRLDQSNSFHKKLNQSFNLIKNNK